MTNFIQNKLQKLRQHSAPAAKAVSFAATTGTIAANSMLFSLPLWLSGAIKTTTNNPLADKTVLGIARHWIATNNWMIDHVLPPIEFDVNITADINPDGQYVMISNHQSWVDTSVLQYVGQRYHLPFIRFFTKHELLYIPVVGQAFYFLDFPMMKRFSKEQIAHNPALKNRDFLEAKRACQQLQNKPFVLLNFVEGTRFSPKKRDQQGSTYANLLKPKAGGLALALGALGQQLDGVLDVTIVYPDGIPTYQDLWQGNLRRVKIDIRPAVLPNGLLDQLIAGKYHTGDNTAIQSDQNPTKSEMYDWLAKLWQQKQQRIETMMQG